MSADAERTGAPTGSVTPTGFRWAEARRIFHAAFKVKETRVPARPDRPPGPGHLFRFGQHGMAFYLGCAGCLLLREQFHFSAVISSAMIGLAGTFIPFPDSHEPLSLQAIVYAGSFAGMCSPLLLASQPMILFASACGALSYLFLRPRFLGFGGKLGASAFVVSLVLLLIFALLR